MKILYVTTAYPPFFDMQTIRNIKLINRLIELGNSVTVLSPKADWLANKNNETFVRNEVNEWKTSPPVFIKMQRFLGKKKSLALVLRVFNVVINYLPIPDIFAGWSFSSKKTVDEKMTDQEFDIIVTSSGGYSAHFIGSRLSKKFNIPWVADYGDPWGLDIYGNKKNLVNKLEEKLLQNCSGLFFTTNNTINSYKKNYKLDNLRVFYLPCGFEETNINLLDTKKRDNFLVVYTGVAFSLSRNLSNAVIAISKLRELNCFFEIVGSYSEKFVDLSKSLNATNVKFRGKVSYEKSIEIITSADILLHIGNFGSLQIPGKTYIYLGTPKPILYIKQEKNNDPTLDLLSRFEGIVISDNNPESIQNNLNDIIKNYDDYLQQSIRRVNSKELKEFTWNNIGDYLDKSLRQVIK